MLINKALAIVKESSEYQNWFKENQHTYLAHFFIMQDAKESDLADSAIQVGFYDDKKDEITCFEVQNEKVKHIPAQEAFKKHDTIDVLDVTKVNIDMQDALKKAFAFQKEKYSAETPHKVIILLQVHENELMYNVTFITQAFTVINVKIDPSNGSILSEKRESVMSWRQD